MSAIVDLIVAARPLLEAEAELLEDAAFEADGPDARDIMRVAVALQHAEDALFDVLNAAAAYLEDADSKSALVAEFEFQ